MSFEIWEAARFKEGGRYLVTWCLNENAGTITLLEFVDSKYPKDFREFHFDE